MFPPESEEVRQAWHDFANQNGPQNPQDLYDINDFDPWLNDTPRDIATNLAEVKDESEDDSMNGGGKLGPIAEDSESGYHDIQPDDTPQDIAINLAEMTYDIGIRGIFAPTF